ncbi:dienelactone hydrolase family protein [Demetria terragena]|uniref:dienelactone hydrolase family protein n=1 Tax=Demetria terragena TaxID=63959 RepID=UPI00037E3B05|nr:dienelactone hydrolase family protein [Demetria terragena]
MSHLLLLHSALGLRPAVRQAAERLRERGHTVHTPDYYDGHVFDDEGEGIAYRDEIGAKSLFARLGPVLDAVPADAALAGFSLGSAFAQNLAGQRSAARAVILLHSVGAPRGPWPGQPVQVHRYADDHWIDPADVEALGAAVRASGASFEDHVVPGRGHLFTDSETADGDAGATDAAINMIDVLLSQEPINNP